MTIKKFNEELSFSLIKCDYKVRTVDNPYMTSAKSKVYQFTVHNVYDVYFTQLKSIIMNYQMVLVFMIMLNI
jgi:hypothetical protein